MFKRGPNAETVQSFLVTATSKAHAALLSYQDVCTRAFTVDEMIQNPRMLVMLGLSQIDFGNDIKDKSRAVSQAIERASPSSGSS